VPDAYVKPFLSIVFLLVTSGSGSYRVKFLFFEFSAKNMQMVSDKDNGSLELLDNLSSLGFRLFIADCSHNIDAPAIAALSVPCVSDKHAENEFVAEVLKENWSAVLQFEIVDRKALHHRHHK
jgi:hypothetical protein